MASLYLFSNLTQSFVQIILKIIVNYKIHSITIFKLFKSAKNRITQIDHQDTQN
jgi:hypothetical protein